MKMKFTLNGAMTTWSGPPVTRLAAALRDDLGFTGTTRSNSNTSANLTSGLTGHRLTPTSEPR